MSFISRGIALRMLNDARNFGYPLPPESELQELPDDYLFSMFASELSHKVQVDTILFSRMKAFSDLIEAEFAIVNAGRSQVRAGKIVKTILEKGVDEDTGFTMPAMFWLNSQIADLVKTQGGKFYVPRDVSGRRRQMTKYVNQLFDFGFLRSKDTHMKIYMSQADKLKGILKQLSADSRMNGVSEMNRSFFELYCLAFVPELLSNANVIGKTTEHFSPRTDYTGHVRPEFREGDWWDNTAFYYQIAPQLDKYVREAEAKVA